MAEEERDNLHQSSRGKGFEKVLQVISTDGVVDDEVKSTTE